MTPPGKSKKELIQLCGQLRETVDQLQSGISGRRKRNRRSGAADRSRKTQKRKAAAVASVNALANVRADNTTMTSRVADAGTHLIAPSPVKGVSLIQEAAEEKERVDKEKDDADVAAKEKQNAAEEKERVDKEKEDADVAPKKTQDAVTDNEHIDKEKEVVEKEDAVVTVEETYDTVLGKECVDKKKADGNVTDQDTPDAIDQIEPADKEPVDATNDKTQYAGNEQELADKETEHAKPVASLTKKCSLWTPEEFDSLARSLIANGSNTTYDTMAEHVPTRTKKAITAYYNNNKNRLLRKRLLYVKQAIGKEVPLENGDVTEQSSSLKQNVEVEPSIDMDNVDATGTVYTVDIIEGAMRRTVENHTMVLATFEDLNEFVHCFFAEIQDQVQSNHKDVRIAGVGTFRQNNNGHLVIMDQPKEWITE